jgi:hypothetical protein
VSNRPASGVSLFFDLYLKEALAGFLVVFRFWRVVRVGTDFVPCWVIVVFPGADNCYT